MGNNVGFDKSNAFGNLPMGDFYNFMLLAIGFFYIRVIHFRFFKRLQSLCVFTIYVLPRSHQKDSIILVFKNLIFKSGGCLSYGFKIRVGIVNPTVIKHYFMLSRNLI